MTSSEDILRRNITELKEKIADIDEQIAQLRNRQKIYEAKLKLMENHLNGYHIKGDTGYAKNIDESFSTTELLELSLSSISSSVLGSSTSYDDDDDDSDQNNLEVNLENGQNGRFRYKQKIGENNG
ncbi:Uncharacterized protein BM_BM8963 [Brugia malayi]|uniref:Bm8963 n=1 Tax=Brugia malayi TaxID=6279 RepID=A0A0J9YAG8_BRUMA|nr:Uncharacterized protein BM_BM8963 [Brugia malayi]CDQ05780.1 Bm8963 [Brugia malayi]VIO89942.1 Uncharacterized protein BM_BM8963 [Brugia malayi]